MVILSQESLMTAIGTCSVREVAVILSQEIQAIDIAMCCPVWEGKEVFYFFSQCVLHGGVLFLFSMRVARRCSISFLNACCTEVFYFFSQCMLHGGVLILSPMRHFS